LTPGNHPDRRPTHLARRRRQMPGNGLFFARTSHDDVSKRIVHLSDSRKMDLSPFITTDVPSLERVRSIFRQSRGSCRAARRHRKKDQTLASEVVASLRQRPSRLCIHFICVYPRYLAYRQFLTSSSETTCVSITTSTSVAAHKGLNRVNPDATSCNWHNRNEQSARNIRKSCHRRRIRTDE
jgi:hypothetical protein